jgi:predicted DNA binding CopG/RHH family protein
MKKTPSKMPEFKTEDQERRFWATHSPLDYFDVGSVRKASFPELKPSLKSISIRVPADMLAELKALANKIDVPYQSLAKVYLARQIALARNAPDQPPRKKRGQRVTVRK